MIGQHLFPQNITRHYFLNCRDMIWSDSYER
jgi:hypothetical protein